MDSFQSPVLGAFLCFYGVTVAATATGISLSIPSFRGFSLFRGGGSKVVHGLIYLSIPSFRGFSLFPWHLNQRNISVY